jgi:hypothetical protein
MHIKVFLFDTFLRLPVEDPGVSDSDLTGHLIQVKVLLHIHNYIVLSYEKKQQMYEYEQG